MSQELQADFETAMVVEDWDALTFRVNREAYRSDDFSAVSEKRSGVEPGCISVMRRNCRTTTTSRSAPWRASR